jgi:sulfur-carrier protein
VNETAVATISVRVRAFARLRELLGGELVLHLPEGATCNHLWDALRERNAQVDEIAASTRVARNGRIVTRREDALAEGDEVALLPPVGGG